MTNLYNEITINFDDYYFSSWKRIMYISIRRVFNKKMAAKNDLLILAKACKHGTYSGFPTIRYRCQKYRMEQTELL